MSYHYIIYLSENLNIIKTNNYIDRIFSECNSILSLRYEKGYIYDKINIWFDYYINIVSIGILPRKIILLSKNELKYEDIIEVLEKQLLMSIKIDHTKAYFIYYDKIIGKSISKSIQFNIPN
ncbi:hypothetical protein [Powai lake megavirus]|uniref:Uncharacterized protein n=1 Tax=Powai lake megavirus TaxID=1842663 RepID=A0A167R5M4_9VIRU|nr:hypothetical protein QJ849_gp173 [Powai lake megavirus]ANB50335.1 hypothetical protein [Powai lake megavirus]